ncbi:MAG: flagellar basal body L-ring protein FlgH [Deltaproteobacteria bacterium]|nr:flagellar basal body L-ring protein FlgH [Deltaproteobacteria bacterium]
MCRRLTIFIACACILCSFSACATRPDSVRPEANLQPVPVVKPSYSPGSLWPGENSRNSLFADNKARYVNDIVTIIVDESSSGQNKASTNSSRDTKTNAGISALLGIDTSILNANPSMGPSISVGGTTANSLKGTGDTSRGGTLQARITAKVVRVLDNGNLLLEGRRQMTLNEEDQFIVITGIVRPEDITADNLVSSSQIADARIVYTGNGVLHDKQRPGWLTRILDWGWPF